MGVAVDHQRPVALERQVRAQVHCGRDLGQPPLKFTTAITAGGPVFGSRQRRTPNFPLMVWIFPSVNMRRRRATVPLGILPCSMARSKALRDSSSSSDTSFGFQLRWTLRLAGCRAAVSASARISEAHGRSGTRRPLPWPVGCDGLGPPRGGAAGQVVRSSSHITPMMSSRCGHKSAGDRLDAS